MTADFRSQPALLLVGPHDPSCGDYTFLAPPLGVWRLAGVLSSHGVHVEVFDPNLTSGPPRLALADLLRRRHWDVVGFSTTGMTLVHDLALAHEARRVRPDATLVAGGMEATFAAERLFELGPFDLAVLGEGERPLREIVDRQTMGAPLTAIPGTVWRGPSGFLERIHQSALSHDELRDAIAATPYHRMPIRGYWERLERLYRLEELPSRAEREARLAEIRSIRLMTLNYCPMACSFCASTNFLNSAQGGIARIARLDAEECMAMLRKIVASYPDARTIIFQDDIFTFTSDPRLLPLCEQIVLAKAAGELPEELQFISTNRIDAMTVERLAAMRAAGFRVLGFGVESFSPAILREFNKARIVPYIEPMLTAALELGITPFLDLILTSPRCSMADLAENVRQAWRWIEAGCEVGMYPYVIPFSGSTMANDPQLKGLTTVSRRTIDGTGSSFDQPDKILPADEAVRRAILDIEARVDELLADTGRDHAHLPSRVRSTLWLSAASAVLSEAGLAGVEPARRSDVLTFPVAASIGAIA